MAATWGVRPLRYTYIQNDPCFISTYLKICCVHLGHQQCHVVPAICSAHPRSRQVPVAVQWGYGRGLQSGKSKEVALLPSVALTDGLALTDVEAVCLTCRAVFLCDLVIFTVFHSPFKIEDLPLGTMCYVAPLHGDDFFVWPYWLRLQHIVHWAGCPRIPWKFNMLHLPQLEVSLGISVQIHARVSHGCCLVCCCIFIRRWNRRSCSPCIGC